MYFRIETTETIYTSNCHNPSDNLINFDKKELTNEESFELDYLTDYWFIIYKLHHLKKIDCFTNNKLKLLGFSKQQVYFILFQKKWNWLKQSIRKRKRLRNKKD